MIKPLFLALLVGTLRAQDAPDDGLEKRFHDIYQSYNSDPTSESEWEIAIGKSKSRDYLIQSGDTLWDVSKTLFGDPHFWPKVWSINGEGILNPHEISKGSSLAFYPGTATEAPVVKVEKAAPDPALEIFPDKVVLQIPPPAKEHPPPADIPVSLPPWAYQKDKDTVVQMELTKISRDFDNHAPLTFVAKSGLKKGAAKVLQTLAGGTISADTQEIYVKFDSEPTEKIWHFFDQRYDLRDLYKDQKVVVVQYLAEAELLEPVNKNQHIYRMLVHKTVSPLFVGSQGLPGPIPSFDPLGGQVGKDVSSRIIGGQFGSNRKIFGTHSLVYLNAGTEQGLQLGDVMDIRRRPDGKGRLNFINENLQSLGRLKIVDVDARHSTAYILDVKDNVRVGDQTGMHVAR